MSKKKKYNGPMDPNANGDRDPNDQPHPSAPQRAETGPMRFGVDWPGVFIRGDQCFAFATALMNISQAGDQHHLAAAERLLNLLLSARVTGKIEEHDHQPMRMYADCELPKTCECGGRILYDFAFGRVFSVCDKCTPVVRISRTELKNIMKRDRGDE